jgi:hypothetical protein
MSAADSRERHVRTINRALSFSHCWPAHLPSLCPPALLAIYLCYSYNALCRSALYGLAWAFVRTRATVRNRDRFQIQAASRCVRPRFVDSAISFPAIPPRDPGLDL